MAYLDYNHPPLLKKWIRTVHEHGGSHWLNFSDQFKKIISFLLKVKIQHVYRVIVCMSSRFIAMFPL